MVCQKQFNSKLRNNSQKVEVFAKSCLAKVKSKPYFPLLLLIFLGINFHDFRYLFCKEITKSKTLEKRYSEN